MEKIHVRKRLIGRQDVNWDTNGVGGSESFVNDKGESFIVSKVNSSHIPTTTQVRAVLGTNDVDSSLLQLDTKIKDVTQGAYLTEDVTLTYNLVSGSVPSFNAEIESVLKNLGGHTLTIYFGDGVTLDLTTPFVLDGFYNGHIKIVGGQNTTLNDLNILDGLFVIRNCLADIEFTDFTFSHHYSPYGFAVYDSVSVGCTNCFFQGASVDNAATHCALYDSSNGYFENCVLTQDGEVFCRSVIERHIENSMEEKFEGVINLVDHAIAWGVASSILACPTADANNLGTGAGFKQSSNYFIVDSSDYTNLPAWKEWSEESQKFIPEVYSGVISTYRYLAPDADGGEYVILQKVTRLDGRVATRECIAGVWGAWVSGTEIDFDSGVTYTLEASKPLTLEFDCFLVLRYTTPDESSAIIKINGKDIFSCHIWNGGTTGTFTYNATRADVVSLVSGWATCYAYPIIPKELREKD